MSGVHGVMVHETRKIDMVRKTQASEALATGQVSDLPIVEKEVNIFNLDEGTADRVLGPQCDEPFQRLALAGPDVLQIFSQGNQEWAIAHINAANPDGELCEFVLPHNPGNSLLAIAY